MSTYKIASKKTSDLLFPNVRPTLDLNFVENQKVPPFINVTRNSQTTYVDKFGILRTADIDQPVFEWDPITGKCLGARIWGVVTNQIRNNTMVGAVAGTPGTLPTNWTALGFSGLTRQIVGIGTFQGVNYVDIRFSGTATGTFGNINLEAQTVIAAANNQAWTSSAWIQVIGGSTLGVTAINFSANQSTSSGAYIAETSNGAISFPVSTTFRRLSRPLTTNQATTAYLTPLLQIGFTNGAAIDITLRIGLPQLEQSATMGPVVKTTTTAASSTADVWSITGADFSRIYNPSATTIYLDAFGFASGGRIYFDDGSGTSERFDLRLSASNWGMFSRGGGVDDGNASSGNNNPTARAAGAIAADALAISVNGATVVTDTSFTMPQNISQMWIGSFRGSSNFANGYIRRLTIYPKRLTDTQLRTLTR